LLNTFYRGDNKDAAEVIKGSTRWICCLPQEVFNTNPIEDKVGLLALRV